MIRVESVLGNRTDGQLREALHHLEHRGSVEFVSIAPADLARRRLLALTDRGEGVGITIPRDQKLYDGAVLVLEESRAIIVRAGAQRWLRVKPASASAALELGYHSGNLHWRVRFEGDDLLVALDGPADAYKARIAPLIEAARVSVSEEPE